MAGIKFGSGTQNHHCKNIGGLKFSGLVRDHHTYNYMQVKKKILADFNLAFAKEDCQIAKFNFLQNFLAIQYYYYYSYLYCFRVRILYYILCTRATVQIKASLVYTLPN